MNPGQLDPEASMLLYHAATNHIDLQLTGMSNSKFKILNLLKTILWPLESPQAGLTRPLKCILGTFLHFELIQSSFKQVNFDLAVEKLYPTLIFTSLSVFFGLNRHWQQCCWVKLEIFMLWILLTQQSINMKHEF